MDDLLKELAREQLTSKNDFVYAIKPETLVLDSFSKVVSTHLWNTPLNLSQQAVKGILS